MGEGDFGQRPVIHRPVLLEECLNFLSPLGESYGCNPLFIDSTLGMGGHAEGFLKQYGNVRIIGVDADSAVMERARQRLIPFTGRVRFHNGWFDDFFANFPENDVRPNLILFDLGISIFHYEASGRGFSFGLDERLDMRLDTSAGTCAGDLVNGLGERDLANILWRYGEERYSRRIAQAVAKERRASPVRSAVQLAGLVWQAVPAAYRHGRIHPATKTFQALRIVVNRELDRLLRALWEAFRVLGTGGKMAVISFNSGEDSMVKNFFRTASKPCICPPEAPICICGGESCAELLTKKPVSADRREIAKNPSSRSAKLRVIRKLRDMNLVRKELLHEKA
ncbi:MAG: 16S rRNA (cytosine(1402)-N(4))-methyltransferase RsmH [Spirochaetaceae bacterium]|jgi:16S rRNA (cytosine1402-N4)-methyltransferase|nr:16S rRNA (cytosine(1402)-N(4))-methyltransferase RsmH [Spirochaetaceae bacterium]